MENGETLQEAAARESQEEALAQVEIGSLLSIVHVLHAHQVHVFFRARLPKAEFAAGPESLEVALVAEADIPWQDIAFPSTEFTLRRYLEDRAAGREPHHFTVVNRPDRRPRRIGRTGLTHSRSTPLHGKMPCCRAGRSQ